MPTFFFHKLSLITLAVLFGFSAYAADFNIKLRKTDINELKQQLMPRFEHNLQVLNQLLVCLKHDNTINACLDKLAVTTGQTNEDNTSRQQSIRQDIEAKINKTEIDRQQVILELEKLLLEAQKVKQCLIKGETANELKDCVLQYSKQEK